MYIIDSEKISAQARTKYFLKPKAVWPVLAKWLSDRLQTKWLWVRLPLLSLNWVSSFGKARYWLENKSIFKKFCSRINICHQIFKQINKFKKKKKINSQLIKTVSAKKKTMTRFFPKITQSFRDILSFYAVTPCRNSKKSHKLIFHEATFSFFPKNAKIRFFLNKVTSVNFKPLRYCNLKQKNQGSYECQFFREFGNPHFGAIWIPEKSWGSILKVDVAVTSCKKSEKFHVCFKTGKH